MSVAASLPEDHPERKRALRVAELLKLLVEPNVEEGQHGPYHRADDAKQRELWGLVSALPVLPGGDDLLLRAIDSVYTRYDANYWTGPLFHWPYLCSERAVRLADKLLAEYPASPLADRTLYLKAYALRLPAAEEWHEAEEDLETYRLQRAWKPDFDAARATYRELLRRFPNGRHARVAKVFAEQPELGVTLPDGPGEDDPKDPLPY